MISKNYEEGTVDTDFVGDMDEKELFELYIESKNPGLRNAIFEKYIYLAEILAKKYINRGVEYQDLFQIASIGLINAIERFDISRGYKFSSFATPTIIGEIKKYFRDKEWMIRVPRRLQKLSKRIQSAKEALAQEYNRNPRVPELAEYLNVTEEEVLEAMEAGGVYSLQSLDEPYNNSDENRDLSLSDLIGANDLNLQKIENRDYIERCISKLDEKELKILKDRYFKGRTQSQIAKDLKVSQMTVSRIEKKILEKFRRELAIN
ncbi:MAG: RNA polymerase sigma factor SigB [Firmicutes bacterium]|nr:RNA polymerase sigma factor SigB [Bacillota bacterium]